MPASAIRPRILGNELTAAECKNLTGEKVLFVNCRHPAGFRIDSGRSSFNVPAWRAAASCRVSILLPSRVFYGRAV
jgi:hypothetical protein